ncbi:MAG: flavin-dependent oxidoreductase [Rhizobiales bacterium]|nr:flavin-dependent oxidoreductase [Hyphomicrobiales bacterium]
MNVMVIGGGVSGLTMALSLHQAGIPVRVYEASRNVLPLGVGINLQPNAVRELDEIGLGARLAAVGNSTRALCFFNKFGQLIWREPRGLAAAYRWPQVSIHRGRLQVLLFEAARERLGDENIRIGCRLTGFAQRGDAVTATFTDPEGRGLGSESADILVGADGIHGTVRRQFYPDEGPPRFGNQILWRAATDAAPFLGGDAMAIAGHFHQRLIVYPIAPSAIDPGKLLTNWIWQMTVAGDLSEREDWNRKVGKEKFWEYVKSWHFDWLDVPRLIDGTEEIFEFPLVDRDPVDRWSFGRVTLIGDAAHPMQPTGSQAGSQAIIDARMLTQALMTIADPVEALAHYDAVRRPVMNDIILRNRQFGPEAAMQIVEERAPEGFARIEDVISADEMRHISQSFQATAGLDAQTVNKRPSYVVAKP